MLRTRLGWTRKWLQRTLPSNGRKLGLTDVCSSRSAIIGMAPGKATSGCLQATIKVDWIQLPVEQYLAALPTLKQGVIAGVFRQKGAAPWGITNAEKLQLSVFLPNELSMETGMQGSMAYQQCGRRSP